MTSSPTYGEGKTKTDKSGGTYSVYTLAEANGTGAPPITIHRPAEAKRAEPDQLHAVYKLWLSMLTLSPAHKQNLRDRGLPDAEIEARGYRTQPISGRARIAAALSQRFGDMLLTVPGIVTKAGDRGDYLTLAGSAGLLIPVRDVQGRIVALKVRRDDTTDGHGKYSAISSKKHGGPGPGSPIHVPLGIVAPVEVARVTEGPLKADVATVLGGVPTIALPSCSSSKSLPEILRTLEVQTVHLSLDADFREKPQVAAGLAANYKQLTAAGFVVVVEVWDGARAKGIDDALLAGLPIEVLAGQAAQDVIAKAVADTKAETTAPEPQPGYGIINGIARHDGEKQQIFPLTMTQILGHWRQLTKDWPRRVGDVLFVDHDHTVQWLDSPAALFGWVSSQTGQIVEWRRGIGCATKEEVFAESSRTATAYQAVETLPHVPPIEGHYYSHKPVGASKGDVLPGLLDRFNPATDIDRDLLLSMFVTPMWGGRGGCRPAFVITSDAGRGSGKTKAVAMLGHLYGGIVELSANEDAGIIRQRLLSPEALSKRIVLLDNVKTLRFSWAELEAMITAPVISGKRMYVGEGQRPNTITWAITLNGVSLATDMAQRSVIIKLNRPKHDANWEEGTAKYVDDHRAELIADIMAFLKRPGAGLKQFSRWGSWERDVLARLPEPEEAQRVIADRQGTADVEAEESEILEDFFAQQLDSLHYSTAQDRIHIPVAVAARWFNWAANSKHTVTAVSRTMRQMIEEGRVQRIVENRCNTYGRGFVWVGNECDPATNLRTDLIDRIARRERAT